MLSKMENGGGNRAGMFYQEALKIEEKIVDARNTSEKAFSAAEVHVERIKSLLKEADFLSDETKAEIRQFSSELKSKLSEHVKAHRDVHQVMSKFGKFIDKNFNDDFSGLTAYFIDRTHKLRSKHNGYSGLSKGSAPSSPFSNDDQAGRSAEELLNLVVIEHLLRQGLDSLATDLMQDFGFTSNEVSLDKFRELSNLVSTIQRGDLDLAKKWLSEHKEQLGGKAAQLEYSLAKLEFLAAMKYQAYNPAAVLHCARQLVPFSQVYPADFEHLMGSLVFLFVDFEHLMGSLVFLGRNLEGTPYEDLDYCTPGPEPMQISPSGSQQNLSRTLSEQEVPKQPSDPAARLIPSNDNPIGQRNIHAKPDSALAHTADLFRACYCHELNLSEMDPLCTVFNSGCRLLSRQQTLQRAISCLSKYSTIDGDTLPVAVELDPVAHQHNIFHCPVIKEITTASNGPVRLSCGHAISRDAFESLPSGDRSKVKCPYCPMETCKTDALDLIF
ncbi:E3 ubiquitin-protein transferase rmnd5a [Clonorchis sinensis]|uniref:E3 ubiquitin-protein transferase rmnd5a n=1 Tax=Clonorchis sinensis TaxID=79923 RepID=A0A8T1MCT9_CLOSI|nr:E3 ubiquitin-protein transferase rmnd5a [Clonorchis sinensis]